MVKQRQLLLQACSQSRGALGVEKPVSQAKNPQTVHHFAPSSVETSTMNQLLLEACQTSVHVQRCAKMALVHLNMYHCPAKKHHTILG